MPTVLIVGPYRFFFYASDGNEPYHVHIERDEMIANVWLEPLRLAKSGGFNRVEIARILTIISTNKHKLLEAWDEYFGS